MIDDNLINKAINFISFNGLNGIALYISSVDVEQWMSILVLASAFAYNIKKISSNE